MLCKRSRPTSYGLYRKHSKASKDGKRTGASTYVELSTSTSGGPCLSPTAALLQRSASSGSSRSDDLSSESILSGELGDSERSASQHSISPYRPLKRQNKSPAGKRPQRKSMTVSHAYWRLHSPQSSNSTLDLPEKSLTIDRKFDKPVIHRGPVRVVKSVHKKGVIEAEDIEVVGPERQSTPSEEYETDIEEAVKRPSFAFDASGRLRYLTICTQLGVAPCSIFLRQCVEEFLSLRHYGLGSKEVIPIGMALLDNTFLTHLDFSYNHVGSKGVFYIARGLKENQHIAHIELAFCNLGAETDGAMALFTIIQNSNNIHSLNVAHNNFRGQDYIWFARMLQLDSRLFSLDLSDNLLGPAGSKVFAAALAKNEILEELSMAWNPLMLKGCGYILKGVTNNWNLLWMDMRHTGLSQIDPCLILNVLNKNEFLKRLDIRENNLLRKTFETVTKAMEVSNSLLDIRM